MMIMLSPSMRGTAGSAAGNGVSFSRERYPFVRTLDLGVVLREHRRGTEREGDDLPMDAKTGDHIVVEGTIVDQARREGEVLEVIGSGDRTCYRVRWQDGHESVFHPGPGAHVTSPS